MPPVRRCRRFWRRIVERVQRQGYISVADLDGMRDALVCGDAAAQALLRRECKRLRAEAEACLLDFLLSTEYESDTVAAALADACAETAEQVYSLLGEISD